MENKNLATTTGNNNAAQLAQTLKQHTPSHPALNRMRSKVMETSGVQAISAYDRMHHRHNRS